MLDAEVRKTPVKSALSSKDPGAAAADDDSTDTSNVDKYGSDKSKKQIQKSRGQRRQQAFSQL